jgi:hypothetical protein
MPSFLAGCRAGPACRHRAIWRASLEAHRKTAGLPPEAGVHAAEFNVLSHRLPTVLESGAGVGGSGFGGTGVNRAPEADSGSEKFVACVTCLRMDHPFHVS